MYGETSKYKISPERFTSKDALKACGKGMRMAMPRSPEDLNQLKLAMSMSGLDNQINPENGIFLGGHMTLARKWIWNDGSKIAKDLWFPGQPEAETKGEPQVCTWPAFDGKFHDCPAEGEWGTLFAACEEGDIPADKLANAADAIRIHNEAHAPTPGACARGFKEKGGDCYIRSTDEMDYHEAVEWCRKKGANMVTIFGDQQNENAKAMCGKHMCWLGLTERGGTSITPKDEQQWQWEDGSPASYLNWQPGQPDNAHQRDERYAHMNLEVNEEVEDAPRIYNGKWFDGHLESVSRALCKTPAKNDVGKWVPQQETATAGGLNVMLAACLTAVLSGSCVVLFFRTKGSGFMKSMFGYSKFDDNIGTAPTELGKSRYLPPAF